MTYPTYSTNRRINRFSPDAPCRIMTAARTRPVLDIHVGAGLWKDRRVPLATKALAFCVGAITMMALVAAIDLLVRWTVAPAGPRLMSMSSLPVVSGALLFSTIALLRLAPASVVNLVRLQREGVIPLRTTRR